MGKDVPVRECAGLSGEELQHLGSGGLGFPRAAQWGDGLLEPTREVPHFGGSKQTASWKSGCSCQVSMKVPKSSCYCHFCVWASRPGKRPRAEPCACSGSRYLGGSADAPLSHSSREALRHGPAPPAAGGNVGRSGRRQHLILGPSGLLHSGVPDQQRGLKPSATCSASIVSTQELIMGTGYYNVVAAVLLVVNFERTRPTQDSCSSCPAGERPGGVRVRCGLGQRRLRWPGRQAIELCVNSLWSIR